MTKTDPKRMTREGGQSQAGRADAPRRSHTYVTPR
jgi:hypothetical protein